MGGNPIAAAVAGAAPAEPELPVDRELADEPRNDVGNARRLIRRHGRDLLPVDGLGWHVWDGRRWDGEAGEAEAAKRAHQTAEAIALEAQELIREHDAQIKELGAAAEGEPHKSRLKALTERASAHRKFGVGSGNSGKVRAMMAEALPYLRRPQRVMDAHPFRLNTQNCTLILGDDDEAVKVRDRPPDRDDLNTHLAGVAYDPEADCPHWHKFLQRILPDEGLRRFCQTWFGYALTGDTSEQAMVVAYGTGGNGKSVLMTVLAEVLGDYCLTTPAATLLHNDRQRGNEATPDLARLPGARLVKASEPDLGSRLSESLIKALTGGEPMMVRKLHEDPFEFVPTFKMVLSANHRPQIRGQDEGIWRRVKLLPFEVQIPPEERENFHGFVARLGREGSGILNWLLDGWRLWREGGLVVPEAVRLATESYRAESDPIGQFLEACTVAAQGGSVQAGELYRVYCEWERRNGREPRSGTFFGRRLVDMGVPKVKAGVISYTGLELTEEAAGWGRKPAEGSGGSEGSGRDGSADASASGAAEARQPEEYDL